MFHLKEGSNKHYNNWNNKEDRPNFKPHSISPSNEFHLIIDDMGLEVDLSLPPMTMG
jgi:hypothetical protein